MQLLHISTYYKYADTVCNLIYFYPLSTMHILHCKEDMTYNIVNLFKKDITYKY